MPPDPDDRRVIDQLSEQLRDHPKQSTLPIGLALPGARAVQRFRMVVVEGAQAGQTWESQSDTCSIGSHQSNDLVLEDPTVSRFHCEIRMTDRGARVVDLDSRNGTFVDGV